MSNTLQSGSRLASDSFNRFVEGGPGANRQPGATERGPAGPSPERADFWDSFAAAGEEYQKKKAEPERKDFWDDFAAAGEQVQKKRAEPERKDFWDEFSAIGDQKASAGGSQQPKPKSSVGTAAMKRNNAATKDEWADW